MHRSSVRSSLAILFLSAVVLTTRPSAQNPRSDFGSFVQDQLAAHSEQLFGFRHPLEHSALGPYTGLDNLQAIQVADGLRVSLVSSAVASAADQMRSGPTTNTDAVFVCDEETSKPAVQRVDLSRPPACQRDDDRHRALIVRSGSADPWGTIIVGEEAGATGGLYELIDPVHITHRDQRHRSRHRRQQRSAASGEAAGGRQPCRLRAWRFKLDGTMIYGDELAPSGGNAGGGIYKFVPAIPFAGGGPITVPAQSPLASGTVYGLRVAASKSSNWGQGAETGAGAWVMVNLAGANVVDASGNIILRTAQALQQFTGYYRPEDMDIDPIAAENGVLQSMLGEHRTQEPHRQQRGREQRGRK